MSYEDEFNYGDLEEDRCICGGQFIYDDIENVIVCKRCGRQK